VTLLIIFILVTLFINIHYYLAFINPHNIISRYKIHLDYHKADQIIKAMHHAFNSYEHYAYGADELRPLSKLPRRNVNGAGLGLSDFGVSIIDAMSTLYTLNMFEEFDRGQVWVEENLFFDKRKTEASFFEATIRLLGGLLAAYDLSGERVFLDKAEDLGSRMMVNFLGSESGILYPNLKLPQGQINIDEGDRVNLAEVGTTLLEFGALSQRLGNETYKEAAERGLRFIHAANKGSHEALLPTHIFRETGLPDSDQYTVGAEYDSYLEYLIKYWIMNKKRDDFWRDRWVAMVDDVLDRLRVKGNGTAAIAVEFEFAGTEENGSLSPVMDHFACFLPGNIALGLLHDAVKGEKAEEYESFAKKMMNACYFGLYNTTTGLGCQSYYYDQDEDKIVPNDPSYKQRPEVIESLVMLYRLTGNDLYQQWGWSIFQAIEKYCKQEAGYSGVLDVTDENSGSDDEQQSFFLAETLKYLYLLFMGEDTLSLDEWVFNTEAHPLRIM